MDIFNLSPAHALMHWAHTKGSETYLRQPINGQWHEYTYAEVADQARRIAAGLKAMGIEKGSQVLITGLNTAHWMMADMAINMIGCIGVGIYPKQSTDAVEYIAGHCEAKAAFIGPMPAAETVLNGLGDMPRISTPYPGVAAEAITWESLLQNEPLPEGEIHHPSFDETWSLTYTSGTTGKPKGVMLNGHAITSSIKGVLQRLPARTDERLFSYLPLAHIFERGAVEMVSLYGGIEVNFLEDLPKLAEQLPMVRPTRFYGVPMVWGRMQQGILSKMPQEKLDKLLRIPVLSWVVKRKIRKTLGLDNAWIMVSGAAPLPKVTIEWFDKLGIHICEGWGMTETGAYGSFNTPDERRVGSIGKANPFVEFKIDPDTSELLFRSSALMSGYYKAPEKTAEVMTEDGWFHTGDMGRIDEDGYAYITGRVKDMFKGLKGKYVEPVPIESELSANSDIEIVCLIGSGMLKTVAIVLSSENGMARSKEEREASYLAQLDEINATLEPHEIIGAVLVVDNMLAWNADNGMLTPTMKVKRPSVEERYAARAEAALEAKEKVVWLED